MRKWERPNKKNTYEQWKSCVLVEIQKKLLVSECIFKLACLVAVAGDHAYVSLKVLAKKSLNIMELAWLTSRFLITMYEVDTTAKVYLEPFQHI